jgi:hypothetical protein
MTATSDITPADREKHKKLLAGLPVGSSFFLPGVLPKHCGYIRKLGYRLNIRLTIRYVDRDEIYGTMGTRIKRVSD